jgi:hypothetical protein
MVSSLVVALTLADDEAPRIGCDDGFGSLARAILGGRFSPARPMRPPSRPSIVEGCAGS